jgi:hypothetical protein
VGNKKPITINETLDRLILDSSERVFYFAKRRLKHKRYAIWLAIVAASAGFALYSLFVKANIFNYYPSSCLGTWDNPQNAEGEPSLEPGAAPEEFNGGNSAFYDGGGAKQIFCGGFKTEADPSEKIFKKAVLKFSWAIAVSPTPLPTGAGGTGGAPSQTLQQSEFENEILDLPASASVIVIPDIPSAASESLENQPSNPEPTPEQIPLGPEPSPVMTEEPTPTPEASATLEPTPIPEPAPESVPPSEPAPPPAESPTSFIKNRILSTIFSVEDEVSGPSLSLSQDNNLPTPSPTSSSFVSPSLTVTPSFSPAASAAVQADQSLTGVASPSQTASLSQSLDNFLEISYSTDGQNWHLLALVSDRNFNNLELEIPITSRVELEKLQISIRGTASDTIKQIYLDGMRIEAQYEIQNEEKDATSGDSTSISEGSSTQESFEQINNQPPPVSLKERKLQKHIEVDPKATHSCRVAPFAIDISNNPSALVKITLARIRGEGQPEEIEIGSLPLGIEMVFANNKDYIYQPQANETTLDLEIKNQPGSQKGNFNIAIIYTSGNSTTMCQINVINF